MVPTPRVPDLEPHCGSWVVVDRQTGKPVLETFERRTAEAINQTRYEVVTAAVWLARINGRNTEGGERDGRA